ncbi:MAG: hypothetical protein HEQ39_13435 [Rhizobacter sp.]
MHPADEALLRSLAQQSSLGQSDSPVSIECDADMVPGCCALVSDVGKVSVSMQTRLDDVRVVLEHVFSTVDITIGEVDTTLLQAPSDWRQADAAAQPKPSTDNKAPSEPSDAGRLNDI